MSSSVRGAGREIRRTDGREGRYREYQGAYGGRQRRDRRPLRYGHRCILAQGRGHAFGHQYSK